MDNLKSEMVEQKVKENNIGASVVKTNNYTSYIRIKEYIWCQIPSKVKLEDAGKIFPFIHTMIANAKRIIVLGHQMLSKKYTQNFLDEFCSKEVRRYSGKQLLDRLLVACVKTNNKDYITQNQ